MVMLGLLTFIGMGIIFLIGRFIGLAPNIILLFFIIYELIMYITMCLLTNEWNWWMDIGERNYVFKNRVNIEDLWWMNDGDSQ